MCEAAGDENARPGVVCVPQTFGSLLQPHPHSHCLASKGLWSAQEPMEPPGRVGCELHETRHSPDFPWDADQVAPIEVEMPHRLQFTDYWGKRNDPIPFLELYLRQSRKHLELIVSCFLDRFGQSLPGVALRVLELCVQVDFFSPRMVVCAEAITSRLRHLLPQAKLTPSRV